MTRGRKPKTWWLWRLDSAAPTMAHIVLRTSTGKSLCDLPVAGLFLDPESFPETGACRRCVTLALESIAAPQHQPQGS